MKNTIEIQNLREVLSKMIMLNINEAYPYFSKKGVVLYLTPCEKALMPFTRKQIEENIFEMQNTAL